MRYLNFFDYQDKLANQEKHLQLLLWNKKDGKYYIYKPKSKSIYGTENQKNNYYKQLRAKLKLTEENTNQKISFVTLTYDTKLYTPAQVIGRCKQDIKNWLKMIRHRVGQVHYMWIVELTKKNYVHFHLIFKEYIPAKIINACWKATTGSIITHVKGISREKAGRYITKYISESSKMSEDQAKFLYDHDFKRLYAHSRGFFVQKLKSKGIFYLLGIITNPLCIVKGRTGEFLEVDRIALNHIVTLMEQGDWGYIKKY